LTDSFYFYFTTGSGLMTLGEEYTQIVPKLNNRMYDPSNIRRVQIRKRIKVVFYLASVFFPYLLKKIFEPFYKEKMQKYYQGI